MFQAKVILDSVNPVGHRLTTMEVTFPRVILAEANTHRAMCLDGDTKLYFDLPSGVGVSGRRVNYITIKDLWRKWNVGVMRPVSRRHEYDPSLVDPNQTYTTAELGRVYGVSRQTFTRLCKVSGLPFQSKGSGKAAVFTIYGRDFQEWVRNRPIDIQDVKSRIRKMHLRCCNEETGEIVYTHVADVIKSGEKQVFRARFEDGKSIICSKDHLFLTENGWLSLEEATRMNMDEDGNVVHNLFMPRFSANGSPAYKDKEWLLQKRKEGLSVAEIAEEAGVSFYAVKGQIRKYVIPVQDMHKVLCNARKKNPPWNKGLSYSLNYTRKPRKPRQKGEKSHFWRGGKMKDHSERSRIQAWTTSVARSVHERNEYKCVLCGFNQKLRAHHIVPVYEDISLAYEIENLTTLCQRCHLKVHAFHLEDAFIESFHGGTLHGFWDRHTVKSDFPRNKPKPPGNIRVVREWVRLVGLECLGVRETYDISVDGPWHNFVADGMIVHNSKSCASSRAIPIKKMVQRVMDDPFIPIYWGRNQKGMQAYETLGVEESAKAEKVWLSARDEAVKRCLVLSEEYDVHKQIANRLLEPWMWVTDIMSATEWDNFFHLRFHESAMPEMQMTAKCMAEAYFNSTPQWRGFDGWHLPYIQDDEWGNSLEVLKKVSAARCARVSYLTHDGVRSIEADLELAERLLHPTREGNDPIHATPFEHVAMAVEDSNPPGNFRGWLQYRKMLERETCWKFEWPSNRKLLV